jgi:hypothetical protein
MWGKYNTILLKQRASIWTGKVKSRKLALNQLVPIPRVKFSELPSTSHIWRIRDAVD